MQNDDTKRQNAKEGPCEKRYRSVEKGRVDNLVKQNIADKVSKRGSKGDS